MADSDMRYDGRTWAFAIGAGAVLWLSGFVLVAGWTRFVEAVGGWRLLAGIGTLLALGLVVLIATYVRERIRDRAVSDPDTEATNARRRDTHRGLGTTDVDD